MQPVQQDVCPDMFVKYDPSVDRSPCGLYLKRRPGLQPLALPLSNIDYQIQIIDNLVLIKMVQEYYNPEGSFLEVDFLVPIDPNACIHKFSASFDNKLVQGVVKERQQAKREYMQALSKGREVAMATISVESNDVLKLEIGNIGPYDSVRVEFEILQELEVSVNTFWKLMLSSHISPRCMSRLKGIPSSPAPQGNPKQQNSLRSTDEPDYTWTFKITLRTSRPITFHRSSSHQLIQVALSQDRKQTVLVLAKSCIPNQDFFFVYTTEDFQKPSAIVGRTDVDITAMVSLIPKFAEISNIDDAYRSQLENTPLDFDMEYALGEYIFLLDRSGSMGGGRIHKAKQALAFFLRSLPQDSFFNVYSFGDQCNSVFQSSSKYNTESLNTALESVSKMAANMGGTVIDRPLQRIFATPFIKGYPKQIFLLTDGGVTNTQQVIDIVARNTKFARVHTIGIGDGCSQALIKGCSQKGKGQHIFIQDKQNVAAKIVGLLATAMSPVVTEFGLDFDSKLVDCVIPNPKDMPYILKNQPVSLFLVLKPCFQGSTKV